jgi:crotonobetainyl-CoA:carnitine CoA-transferase CaiB-like acyl-CoA transferase
MTHLPALHGLKVIDLSRVLAGPLAAQILADLGADVLKIERPGKGDDTREWAPPFLTPNKDGPLENSAYFWSCNRGKKSLTADIGTDAGRDLVLRLALDADVLIENYKVGTLARYGLDYETLAKDNPRLIYCSITGFGQTGPYRKKPGYDTIVQAMGGLMSITGSAADDEADSGGGGPTKSGVAVADQMTALYASVAILAALQERQSSGLGQAIDMSLLDVQVASLTNIGLNFLATGKVPVRQGNRLATVYPSDTFRCSDGDIMLIVGNDAQYRRFCDAMGVPELAIDTRFASNASRLQHVSELDPLLRQIFARMSLIDCQTALDAVGVPAAPINDLAAVFKDPQVMARGMVRTTKREDGSEVRSLANPIRMSRSRVMDNRGAPKLGEHTDLAADGWPQS